MDNGNTFIDKALSLTECRIFGTFHTFGITTTGNGKIRKI